MSASKYRQNNKSFSRNPQRKKGKSIFLIFTEGLTEKNYLEQLKSLPRYQTSRFDIEIINPKHSDPKTLFQEAKQKAEKICEDSEIIPDQKWVVFDVDIYDNNISLLNKILHNFENNGFKCAITNLCFENWLFLHHKYSTTSFHKSSQVEQALKKYIKNYSKKEKDNKSCLQEILPRLDEAIKNAKKLTETNISDKPEEKYPNPSTQIHLLIQEIEKLAAEDSE